MIAGLICLVISTQILLLLVGLPFSWPSPLWQPSPFTGTRFAFLVILFGTFAVTVTLFRLQSFPKFLLYSLIIPIQIVALIFSLQEITHDSISFYEISEERPRRSHFGLEVSSAVEEYVNAKSGDHRIIDEPRYGEALLLDTIKRKFPQKSPWRSKLVRTMYDAHNGYTAIVRIDNEAGSVAVRVGQGSSSLAILGWMLKNETPKISYYSLPIWKRFIASHGVFRAFEGSLFRTISLYLILLLSFLGLWRSFQKFQQRKSTVV